MRNAVSHHLDPRWESTIYQKNGKTMVSRADVRIEMGQDGPEVVNNGKGTSLHDVSGWSEPEEMPLLEEWQDTARDLEQAYDEEAKRVLNLPPYGELTGAG